MKYKWYRRGKQVYGIYLITSADCTSFARRFGPFKMKKESGENRQIKIKFLLKSIIECYNDINIKVD